MRSIPFIVCCTLALVLSFSSAQYAAAFCCFGGPPPTLSQQLFEADGAFLARLVSKAEFNVRSEEGDEYIQHVSTFELIESLKPGLIDVSPRMHVVLDYEYDGAPGDLAVLFGSLPENQEEVEDDDKASEELSLVISGGAGQPRLAQPAPDREIVWSATSRLTWEGYRYIRGLTFEETEGNNRLPSERLSYFIQYLEHPDPVVADDAFTELDSAEFADLVPLADRLPRDKLRQWMKSTDEQLVYRRIRYGTLLGLCGTRDDAKLLRRIALTVPSPDDEAGFELYDAEGAMIGYLLLTGERGLNDVVDNVLSSQTAPAETIFLTFGAIQFLAANSPETISMTKLRFAVHCTLTRQDSAASAIGYLTQLEDWDSQDEIIALLDACGYESEEIRGSIVDYLQASAAKKDDPALRSIAARAEAALVALKHREPVLFEDTSLSTTAF